VHSCVLKHLFYRKFNNQKVDHIYMYIYTYIYIRIYINIKKILKCFLQRATKVTFSKFATDCAKKKTLWETALRTVSLMAQFLRD